MSNILLQGLPLPEVYYEGGGGGAYRKRDERGTWITLNERSVRLGLRAAGFPSRPGFGELVSGEEQALLDIQHRQSVDYVGDLAGFASGVHEAGGKRLLVTSSPRLVLPQAGGWPVLAGIFGQMFVDGDLGLDQRPYFFGWLHVWLRSLYERRWQPGQALVLAGAPRTFKSFTQAIITAVSGGRSAKPYLFMTKGTPFNADLFGAEHLMVEDDAESVDMRARMHFGAELKALSVNETHHCHGKHRGGLSLPPRRRLSISLNDEPERLMVLPPVNGDIADKLMLLRTSPVEPPVLSPREDGRDPLWPAVVAELPAFVYAMLGHEIAPALRCPRTGIRHFHHPHLLEALNQTSPEIQLLEMIDEVLFGERSLLPAASPWIGKANELEERLTAPGSPVARRAQRLLYYTTACGVYLQRLAGKRPGRVGREDGPGRSRWRISPPAERS